MRRLAAGLLVAGVLLAQSTRAQAAPILWSENGHYYEIQTILTTWTAALAAADAATFNPGSGVLDGYLVTVTSAAEDSFLSSTFGSTNSFWIAGTDQAVEGVWRWAAGPENGSLVSFFDWGAGEPNDSGNQDYIIANWFFTPGLWDDQSAFAQFRYVIEYSAPASSVPEPTSLLLLSTGVMVFAANLRRRRTSPWLQVPGAG